MEKNKITPYNQKAFYEKNLQPAVEQIIRLCRHYGIPCFIAIAVQNSEEGTEYVKESVCPNADLHVKLKEDYIHRFIDVLLGFQVVPPNEITEIELPND